MALNKPYLDVPGTTIFDAEQSRKGYHLNQFCMSLMKAENRARFNGRSPEGNRYVGEDGDAQAHRQPQGQAGKAGRA
jgi:protocatechuate 4,5-dioxygenase alpha subunit